jgi:hypothetical protein
VIKAATATAPKVCKSITCSKMRSITLFFLIPIINCLSQETDRGKYIEGKYFEGYVFPKENILETSWIPFTNLKERLTPTPEEIIYEENVLKDQIKGFNQKSLTNQGRGCPIIHRNLKRYKRQYFGYLNSEGEKIIWINLIWDSNKRNLQSWDKKSNYRSRRLQLLLEY